MLGIIHNPCCPEPETEPDVGIFLFDEFFDEEFE